MRTAGTEDRGPLEARREGWEWTEVRREKRFSGRLKSAHMRRLQIFANKCSDSRNVDEAICQLRDRRKRKFPAERCKLDEEEWVKMGPGAEKAGGVGLVSDPDLESLKVDTRWWLCHGALVTWNVTNGENEIVKESQVRCLWKAM